MKLSAFILSERLRWSLREEKGFTYSIQVDSVQGDAYPEIGLFLIRLTCDPKSSMKFLPRAKKPSRPT